MLRRSLTLTLLAACSPSNDSVDPELQVDPLVGSAPSSTEAGRPQSSAQGSSSYSGTLWIGEAEIDVAELEILVESFSHSFDAFGHDTLAWHLLDGGLGASAILHHNFAQESADAKTKADAAANRISEGETFFAVYQDLGGDPNPASISQPTPFGLGARVAALMATRVKGEWLGPVATMDGWEIVFLEERNEAIRSRAGIRVRSILFPIATDDDRRKAREDWAKLPLRATPAVLRALPASFRRGRTTPLPK